jgi:rhamnulokinase
VLTEAGRAANFSNERGVDSTVRYLRNVMGPWLLQECLRPWGNPDLPDLLAEARDARPFAAVVDANDPAFLPPGDMPGRIAATCRASGQPEPSSRGLLVRADDVLVRAQKSPCRIGQGFRQAWRCHARFAPAGF